MEALSIFSLRGGGGGYLPVPHLDSDSSWITRSRNFAACFRHPSASLTDGARRRSIPRTGFSRVAKVRSFAASLTPELASEEGAVGSEFPEARTDKDAILEPQIPGMARSAAAPGGKARINVRALARKLWDCRTAEDVGKVFDEMPELPPAPVYTTIVKGLGSNNKVNSALALVDWLRRKGKDAGDAVGPNIFIYNSLLSVLLQSRRFEDANRIMREISEDGMSPSIVTYNLTMSIYIEQGKASAALDVLDEINKAGLVPRAATYSIALLAYFRMGDVYSALLFYEALVDGYAKGEICQGTDEDWEQEFVKLKDYVARLCCDVMRQWICSNGESGGSTTEILGLLAAMDRAKITPGRAMYEKLVWACTNEGHFLVAKELYARLRGLDCDVSLSVCNHVIWLMGKAKKWWAALEVYEDLLSKGPEPNNVSSDLIMLHFNVLLNSIKRKGHWKWGVWLIDKMQEKGLKPQTKDWNAVLVACSRASEASTAVQIFRRMIEEGEKPDILSYGALLGALKKAKFYDEAMRVWDHMCKMDVKPNVFSYTIMASIYIGKGELDKAESLIHEMDSSGVAPTVVTFNSIITECTRNNLAGAAFEWYHRMKIRNLAPDEITYEILIECLAGDGKSKLALEMYKKALKEGLNMSQRAYDLVVESCHQCGASADLSSIGPRPVGGKKTTNTRAFSDFHDPADSGEAISDT